MPDARVLWSRNAVYFYDTASNVFRALDIETIPSLGALNQTATLYIVIQEYTPGNNFGARIVDAVGGIHDWSGLHLAYNGGGSPRGRYYVGYIGGLNTIPLPATLQFTWYAGVPYLFHPYDTEYGYIAAVLVQEAIDAPGGPIKVADSEPTPGPHNYIPNPITVGGSYYSNTAPSFNPSFQMGQLVVVAIGTNGSTTFAGGAEWEEVASGPVAFAVHPGDVYPPADVVWTWTGNSWVGDAFQWHYTTFIPPTPTRRGTSHAQIIG